MKIKSNIRSTWEKFLYIPVKIPNYLVFFVFFSNIILFCIFGNYILNNGKNINKIVYHFINYPNAVKQVIKGLINKEMIYPNVVIDHFSELDGFKKNGILQKHAIEDNGYLLLSSFSQKNDLPEVSLIDISVNALVHKWQPDIENLVDKKSDKYRYRMVHPLLFDNGDIVFSHTDNDLIKMDINSDVIWMVEGQFHHSKEFDGYGNIWTCGIINGDDELDSFSKKFNFRDDAIIKVSSSGKVMFKKSVASLLYENGFESILTMSFGKDPIHLNDVQPALEDSDHWEKGDLLLSIRNRNMVLLYRPTTNKVIWYQIGPWQNQHDVDFFNEKEITVYGNDIIIYNNDHTTKNNFDSNRGWNTVYNYSFDSDSIKKNFDKVFEENKINTPYQGLSKTISNKYLFVEETENGRLLKLSKNTVLWEFVNRKNEDYNYVLNWSRYIEENEIPSIFK